jgi:hypothetical protein
MFEIKGGIQVPLSNEERRLVEMFDESASINVNEMDQRDAELARLLCARGVLTQIEETDESLTYSVNKLEDIWRD